MIIHSEVPLKIGQHVVNGEVNDIHYIYHVVSFIVIRKATFDEYLKCIEDCGGVYNPNLYTTENFYEVQMD